VSTFLRQGRVHATNPSCIFSAVRRQKSGTGFVSSGLNGESSSTGATRFYTRTRTLTDPLVDCLAEYSNHYDQLGTRIKRLTLQSAVDRVSGSRPKDFRALNHCRRIFHLPWDPPTCAGPKHRNLIAHDY
jgi:hypothetical protein